MGIFITFEGIDGAGKTTQIEKLQDKYINNSEYKFIFTRNPGGTLMGQKLREMLLKDTEIKLFSTAELLLYMADRAQHMNEIIIPALKEQNTIVICDRFIDSTMAYQGYGRGLDLEQIDKLNNIAIQGVRPEITLLFDLSADVAMRRLDKLDKIEQEGIDFLRRVRDGYLKISKQEKERFKIINTEELSIEDIFIQVEKIIFEKLQCPVKI